MTTKEYPELLLCRFTQKQRAFIRNESRKGKISDAGLVRLAVNHQMELSRAKTPKKL